MNSKKSSIGDTDGKSDNNSFDSVPDDMKVVEDFESDSDELEFNDQRKKIYEKLFEESSKELERQYQEKMMVEKAKRKENYHLSNEIKSSNNYKKNNYEKSIEQKDDYQKNFKFQEKRFFNQSQSYIGEKRSRNEY